MKKTKWLIASLRWEKQLTLGPQTWSTMAQSLGLMRGAAVTKLGSEMANPLPIKDSIQ